jgi:hypothetical protein
MPISEISTSAVEVAQMDREVAAMTGPCYVCFEDGAPASPCLCKDRFLHRACMLNMTNVSGKAACSVCLAEYQDMVVRSRYYLSPFGKLFIVVATSYPFLSVPTIVRAYTWMLNTNGDDAELDVERLVETVVEVTMLSFLSCLFLYLAYLYNIGRWRFFRVKRESCVRS